MEISLIYNYSEGEQDLTGKIPFDKSILKNKAKFRKWLLEYPATCDGEDRDDDSEPYDIAKLSKLSFVSVCLYYDTLDDVPKWYDETGGRFYFKSRKS